MPSTVKVETKYLYGLGNHQTFCEILRSRSMHTLCKLAWAHAAARRV